MIKIFLCTGIVVALILCTAVWNMFAATFNWKLWLPIYRARGLIRVMARQRVPTADVISMQGATSISPRYLSFSIKTTTDRERDLLRNDPEIINDFRKALRVARYPEEAIELVKLGVESQETIDREHAGNWNEY